MRTQGRFSFFHGRRHGDERDPGCLPREADCLPFGQRLPLVEHEVEVYDPPADSKSATINTAMVIAEEGSVVFVWSFSGRMVSI
jgi:hypothetical protein